MALGDLTGNGQTETAAPKPGVKPSKPAESTK